MNALHDYWFESNANAIAGIKSLGYHAVKLWPRSSYLAPELVALYTDPTIDVIVLRPLENSAIEAGCAGDHWRWENIDYGDVAEQLYLNFGDQNKVIVLTGWEADNQINGLGCGGTPPQSAIDDYIDMLNARQAGVTAARSVVFAPSLNVLHAVEVNHVASDLGFSVLNTIIPAMDSPPDLISYSAWGPGGQTANVQDKLNIIEQRSGLPRYRIFVGEFGRDHNLPGTSADVAAFGDEVFSWGASMLFQWAWRMEFPGNGYQEHSLVTGTWPSITPTANHTGLAAVRAAWDNFQAPDIDVTDGFGVPAPRGGSVALSSVPVGQSTSKAFIIKNTGSLTLALSNHLTMVSGDCFWEGLGAPPASQVQPGGSTTFRVWFQCPVAGNHVGEVTILSNDPDESPWTFEVTATAF